MESELTATLIINRWDSRCGYCGGPVLPDETHHENVSGYTPVTGGGCGARFINLSSDYLGLDESIQALRPDLPLLGGSFIASPVGRKDRQETE